MWIYIYTYIRHVFDRVCKYLNLGYGRINSIQIWIKSAMQFDIDILIKWSIISYIKYNEIGKNLKLNMTK